MAAKKFVVVQDGDFVRDNVGYGRNSAHIDQGEGQDQGQVAANRFPVGRLPADTSFLGTGLLLLLLLLDGQVRWMFLVVYSNRLLV